MVGEYKIIFETVYGYAELIVSADNESAASCIGTAIAGGDPDIQDYSVEHV